MAPIELKRLAGIERQLHAGLRLRAVETKKAVPQPIGWLARDENALLAVPGRRTERGRIEHALPLPLYIPGA